MQSRIVSIDNWFVGLPRRKDVWSWLFALASNIIRAGVSYGRVPQALPDRKLETLFTMFHIILPSPQKVFTWCGTIFQSSVSPFGWHSGLSCFHAHFLTTESLVWTLKPFIFTSVSKFLRLSCSICMGFKMVHMQTADCTQALYRCFFEFLSGGRFVKGFEVRTGPLSL